MRQVVTKELYAYWNGLRGARSAPDRSDIDPVAIRHVLADTFILEIDTHGLFPIRLCGTRLSALWLSDRKGISFLDLWRADQSAEVSCVVRTVVDGVTPVVAGGRANVVGGLPVDIELLLLPLRHFGRTHSRVLGSIALTHQPNWYGRMPVKPLEITSLRIIDRDEARTATAKVGSDATLSRVSARAPRFVVHEGGKSREAPGTCL